MPTLIATNIIASGQSQSIECNLLMKHPRPVYIIGHRCNDLDDIRVAVTSGANAIECDLKYDDEKIFVRHGGWRGARLSDWLLEAKNVAKGNPHFTLIIFDMKFTSTNAFNKLKKEVNDKLENNLNVVFSIADYDDRRIFYEITQGDLQSNEVLAIDQTKIVKRKTIDIIEEIGGKATKKGAKFVGMKTLDRAVGNKIKDENWKNVFTAAKKVTEKAGEEIIKKIEDKPAPPIEDTKVETYFKEKGINNCWYGYGVMRFGVRKIMPTIKAAVKLRDTNQIFKKVYVWTLVKKSSIREYLEDIEVDGVMVNVRGASLGGRFNDGLQDALEVVKESPKLRLATRKDSVIKVHDKSSEQEYA